MLRLDIRPATSARPACCRTCCRVTPPRAARGGRASPGAGPDGQSEALGGFWTGAVLNLPSLYQPVHAALAQKIPVGQRAYILHDVSVVDYSRHERKEVPVLRGRVRLSRSRRVVLGAWGAPCSLFFAEPGGAAFLQITWSRPSVPSVRRPSLCSGASLCMLRSGSLMIGAPSGRCRTSLLFIYSGAASIAKVRKWEQRLSLLGGRVAGAAFRSRNCQAAGRFYDQGGTAIRVDGAFESRARSGEKGQSPQPASFRFVTLRAAAALGALRPPT